MRKFLKFLHLLGLTLFLGSIFGHIVASVGAGEPGTPNFLFAREEIALATRVLTLPGLLLAIVSGFALMTTSQISPLRHRWLTAKAVLAAVIMINCAFFVVPSGANMLAGAIALSHNEEGATAAKILAAKTVEDIAGAFNILLTFLIIFLGVFKPALALRHRHARDGALISGRTSKP